MRELILVVRGTAVRCSVERERDQFVVRVDGVTHRLGLSDLEHGMFRLSSAGRSHIVRTARGEAGNFLHIDGCTVEYVCPTTPGVPGSPSRGATSEVLAAPMPGAVTQVFVGPGDEVRRGQPLAIIEAMKVEHVIRAPRAGSVRAVHARAGDQVDAGVVVVEMSGSGDEATR